MGNECQRASPLAAPRLPSTAPRLLSLWWRSVSSDAMAARSRRQPCCLLVRGSQACYPLIRPRGRQQSDAERQHGCRVARGRQVLAAPPPLLGGGTGIATIGGRRGCRAQQAAEHAHAAHVLQVDEVGPPAGGGVERRRRVRHSRWRLAGSRSAGAQSHGTTPACCPLCGTHTCPGWRSC